jgi:hypothetical protein
MPLGRFGLGLFWSLGLSRRKFAAKSESDSARNAEVTLVGSAEAVQVTGEDIVARSQLKSNMTKEPIINAAARS